MPKFNNQKALFIILFFNNRNVIIVLIGVNAVLDQAGDVIGPKILMGCL